MAHLFSILFCASRKVWPPEARSHKPFVFSACGRECLRRPTFCIVTESRQRARIETHGFYVLPFLDLTKVPAKTARRSKLALCLLPASLPLLLCRFGSCSSATAPRRARTGGQPPSPTAAARQRGWVDESIQGSAGRGCCEGCSCSPPGGLGVTQGGLVPLEIAPASAGFVTPAGVTAIGVPLWCVLW